MKIHAQTIETIKKTEFQVVEVSYSPDVAPTDYHFFGPFNILYKVINI